MTEELNHGMNGTSDTHCCYKHEIKSDYQDLSEHELRTLFSASLPDTFTNSFSAMDECDAISELLEARGIDIFREHGLAEDQTRLFTKGDDAEEL